MAVKAASIEGYLMMKRGDSLSSKSRLVLCARLSSQQTDTRGCVEPGGCLHDMRDMPVVRLGDNSL
jgi:hypothetical protein